MCRFLALATLPPQRPRQPTLVRLPQRAQRRVDGPELQAVTPRRPEHRHLDASRGGERFDGRTSRVCRHGHEEARLRLAEQRRVEARAEVGRARVEAHVTSEAALGDRNAEAAVG